jgi:DNA-binding NarL/FixJ family response regulator
MRSAAPPRRVTVVVVDDHRTFTELLTMALDAHDVLDCIGTATDTGSTLSLLERQVPDVVVMDYRLGAENGVALTQLLTQRWPKLYVILLTAYPTHRLLAQAASAGACALLPKDGSLSYLLDAMLDTSPGRFTVPPALLRLLVTAIPSETGKDLTHRELDVLHLLALGHDVRRIARHLCITVNTARGHVKSILAKLDAHSQLEAVVAAHRAGLLTAGEFSIF